MFKQPAKLVLKRNNLSALLRHGVHSESTKTGKNHKWDLLSAVCLERHPIITQPMNDLETKFQRMLRDIEYENSMKCDHELRRESESRQLELQKRGLLDIDLDTVIQQTAQDLEDAGDKELAAFKLASRTTEADEKNVKNSLERKLDKCLVLLVEQQFGGDKFWLPPQGQRSDGESMRQTAERVLKEICGDELKARIYGNAPMGFYKYAYPRPLRENGTYGAKVFYYLAKYLKGGMPETIKYQWLDRRELAETMPSPMHRSVSMFLVSE